MVCTHDDALPLVYDMLRLATGLLHVALPTGLHTAG